MPPLQRDPGPWNRLLLNWLATLAIIMVFGLVMLYSASYTTGYLRMGDSLHYIKQQAICMAIGIGCMVVMSYVDHRFLRWASKPLYWCVLAMLAVTLTFAPLNGCRRWIRLGGLTLQTSEVAKFEMILLSSHLAAKCAADRPVQPVAEKRSTSGLAVHPHRKAAGRAGAAAGAGGGLLLFRAAHVRHPADHRHRGHHPHADRLRRCIDMVQGRSGGSAAETGPDPWWNPLAICRTA